VSQSQGVAALILAGGESRRMGSPKALLKLSGRTFLDRLILAFAPHCDPVVVVLGHEAGKIRAAIEEGARAMFALNENYRLGQLSSMQCGLRAIPASARGVLFTPVDYPAIQAQTVDELVRSFQPDRYPVAVPRYCGERGHPVCVGPDVIAQILALDPGAQARDVIHRYRNRTFYVDVKDAGVIKDIDDPDAYRRLVEASEP